MKILILGGTRFLGKAITEEALRRNHEITLFNRGRENPALFSSVHTVNGDRVTEIERLGDGEWDVVIDTCGFLPWQIQSSVEYLQQRVKRYIFISSQSVYSNFSTPDMNEEAPVATLLPEQVKQLEKEGYGPYGEHYGAMKYLCEQLVERFFPGRALHVRAGLIVGPSDYSDRFTYWVHRVAQGGEILAPGRPERLIQLIDARDLAYWIIDMAERKQTGVYNVTGFEQPLTMGELLEQCKQVSGSDATFTWVGEVFLLEQRVQPWIEMPLWLPEQIGMSEEEQPPIGFFQMNIDRALATGLQFRSLAQTIADTFAWLKEEKKEEWKAGIALECEQILLKKWKEQIHS